MLYFQTPVTVKDVEFESFVYPNEKDPFGILYMTFRLPSMQRDRFLIAIKKDTDNQLYSNYITYQEAEAAEEFGPMFDFDEEEHLEILKAVINDAETQQELLEYDLGTIEGVYVRHEPYEVVLHHCDLNDRVEPHGLPKSLDAELFAFKDKTEAHEFYQEVFRLYSKKSYDFKGHSFGALKFYWHNEQTGTDTLTYALFLYKGEEIMSEEAYQALESDGKRIEHAYEAVTHKMVTKSEMTRVQDVEFHAYYPTQEYVEETFYFSFRTEDMEDDQLILDITRDEDGDLFSSTLLFFDADEREEYNVTEEFDEDEVLDYLYELLSVEVVKNELRAKGWNPEKDCYVAFD